MGILRGDTNQIGLDIGNSGVRMVQVRPSRSHPTLVTFGAVPIDVKTSQSSSEIDRQNLSQAIHELLRTAKATTHNVVVGLPSLKTFSTLITMPKMSESELNQAVRYQAEQHVPFSVDEAQLDWVVTGDAVTKDQNSGEQRGSDQVEVLLVATKTSVAADYLDLLESLKLNVVGLEPDAFGLVRSLVQDEQPAVVVNVGSATSDIVVSYQGTPRLLRSVGVGGETLVKAAQHNLNIDREQAEQYAFTIGFDESKLEGQVAQALKSNMELLAGEVQKSVTFFANRYGGAPMSKLILTGGASSVPQLAEGLANQLNLPVEIGNTWSKISYSSGSQAQLSNIANQFAVAAGLAIRGAV